MNSNCQHLMTHLRNDPSVLVELHTCTSCGIVLSVCVRSLGSFTGGLASGLCCLASGIAIGTIANSATRTLAEEPKLYVGMILILIFAEALGESYLCGLHRLNTCAHTYTHTHTHTHTRTCCYVIINPSSSPI